jgi:hypothetical protein
VTVLFDDDVPVHYGFIFLSAEDGWPELMDTRRGQQNGLCGAAVPGVLSLITGLHTGRVRLGVEWLDAEPALDPQWEDVVEVSFTPARQDLTLFSFEHSFDVRLPTIGDLRARYCARGMDAARQQDTAPTRVAAERYLLQLWPGAPGPDSVLRQTSGHAAYWHGETRALRPPPTAEERAAAARADAERARRQAQLAAERHDLLLWGGRRPSPRLRELGGNVIEVARSHPDLLDAFEALDAAAQRAAARWLARRAFEIAGLDRLDWVRPALDAMDAGAALPEPFTELAAVFPLVRPAGRTTRVAVLINRADAAPRPKTRVHRPSFALPAIFSAVHPDPLRALVDTFSHAAATFDDRRDTLVSELRRRWIDRPG